MSRFLRFDKIGNKRGEIVPVILGRHSPGGSRSRDCPRHAASPTSHGVCAMSNQVPRVREPDVPSLHDWRTTDEQEIARRRLRARVEGFAIANRDPVHPIFSNFRVRSGSGMTYGVEIRDLAGRQFACECVDFRINGLGTCKHVEAVLQYLEARFKRLFQSAARQEPSRIDLVPDVSRGTLRLLHLDGKPPEELREWFREDGWLRDGEPEEAIATVERLRASGRTEVRVSQEVAPWLEARRQQAERRALRRECNSLVPIESL